MAKDNVTVVVAAPTRTAVPTAEKSGKFSGVNFKGWQQQELQLIFHNLIAEDMVVNEAFQVAAIIENLSPSWNDFKNYLKHKHKEMKLEDLMIRLKIEEDNKTVKMKSRKSSTVIGVNILEEAPTKENIKKSNRQKSEQAKKKFKGNCYNYGKAGHKSSNCRAPRKDKDKDKGKGKSQANIVEEMEDADDLCAMISECNLVGNPKEWFLDSGATRYICSAK